MKIAIFNSLFPPLGIGGSEMSTYFLARELRRIGHRVQVISENVENRTESTDIDGVKILRMANPDGYGPNVLDEPIALRIQRRGSVSPAEFETRLLNAMPNFSADVIHTNVIGGLRQIWAMASRRKIPVVHTLRSYSMICSRRMLVNTRPCVRQCRDCAAPVGRTAARDDSSSVQAVVGISNHILRVYREAGWFANVRDSYVIGNGYDKENSYSGSGKVREETFNFGFIGRIHRTKGVEEFLSAIREAQMISGNRFSTIVAGSGNPDYVQTLKDKYSDLDIDFAGYLRPAEFFARVRFCVVPSIWYEPFGRIYIESLAYGVPVIASERGGGAEIVSDDCGYRFDPGNAEQFVNVLTEAAKLPEVRYEALQAGALNQAEKYSNNKIAQDYVTVYQAAIKRMKRGCAS